MVWISDSWYSFAQNEKVLEDYYARLENNEIPVFRGHVLTSEDLMIRQHILNLMCQFETSWQDPTQSFEELPRVLQQLEEMQQDQLLKIGEKSMQVTEQGKAFVRNICMAFDLRMKRKIPNNQIFSMTI